MNYSRHRLEVLVRRMSRASRQLLCAGALGLAATSPVSALTINANFAGGSAPSTNVFGAGNLATIFATAADWWEAAILDPHALTISYSWGPVSGHAGITTTNGSVRPSTASIVFDNDGTTQWYMDPTPGDASEYSTYSERVVPNPAAGVSSIITGRRSRTANQSDATKLDMLTLAAHEIGHALGFGLSNSNPIDFLTISTPLPKAGVMLWADDLTHIAGLIDPSFNLIETPEALMGHDLRTDFTQNFAERKYPSELDVLAIAQRAGFSNVNLNPVPEPGTYAMMLAGLGLVGWRLRRRVRRAAARNRC